ncbi:hypothetical protein [Arachnia propionica]|uniref:hypothetical protein n=1 Tax=Arachnia propionica TaxID=1750 RepID=UPI000F70F44E|nr:hypothetical protein [Arachnia propionica]VEJ59467.1 Uncharacterised protein [Arachnia propionica]
MVYEPPLNRTSEIDGLCMEIAELVGALGPASALGTNRELRITTIHSSLMIEVTNARRAYQLMDDLDPLSPDDLLRTHGVMMRGLIGDAGPT